MKNSMIIALPLVAAAWVSSVAAQNGDFSPPVSQRITESLELRERYKVPLHTGKTAVFLDSTASTKGASRTSTIVWRDPLGDWRLSRVSEVLPAGRPAKERKIGTTESRTLPKQEGQALDRLISDQSLYSRRITDADAANTSAHVMALITPYGRATMSWNGRLPGAAGEIATIALGKD